jgi:hypothetical protein
MNGTGRWGTVFDLVSCDGDIEAQYSILLPCHVLCNSRIRRDAYTARVHRNRSSGHQGKSAMMLWLVCARLPITLSSSPAYEDAHGDVIFAAVVLKSGVRNDSWGLESVLVLTNGPPVTPQIARVASSKPNAVAANGLEAHIAWLSRRAATAQVFVGPWAASVWVSRAHECQARPWG